MFIAGRCRLLPDALAAGNAAPHGLHALGDVLGDGASIATAKPLVFLAMSLLVEACLTVRSSGSPAAFTKAAAGQRAGRVHLLAPRGATCREREREFALNVIIGSPLRRWLKSAASHRCGSRCSGRRRQQSALRIAALGAFMSPSL